MRGKLIQPSIFGSTKYKRTVIVFPVDTAPPVFPQKLRFPIPVGDSSRKHVDFSDGENFDANRVYQDHAKRNET